MNTDRNLLFAVLALQADVIDAEQFVQVCTLWTTRKETAVADLLIELSWITSIDRADVERLMDRKLKRHGGDARAGLGAIGDEVKRSLAALQDDDIQKSLCDLPGIATGTMGAIDEDIPTHQDRYALTRLHASGGIGRIWVARDTAFGRNVALKELRPERAVLAAHRARFLQEARITGQLDQEAC